MAEDRFLDLATEGKPDPATCTAIGSGPGRVFQSVLVRGGRLVTLNILPGMI